MHDPRVQIVYDDARHFVLTTHEKFDIITSDPIHPWVKGSATLYSKEYFELVKQHLNPGGVVTQWVPLYESDAADGEERNRDVLRRVSQRHHLGQLKRRRLRYRRAGAGRARPDRLDALEQRLARPDHAASRSRCTRSDSISLVGLLATYGGQESDLRPLAGGMPRSIAMAICGCSTWPGWR